MSNRIPAILLGAAGLLGAAHAAAESAWDFAANVDVEARYFFDDVLWSGQDDGAAQLAVAATAELRWRSAEGAARASVLPYLRRDTTDEERDLADLREAYWAWEGGSWEVLVGANTVFWGVTETSHLVDVINQTDGVADVDGEDKLGQPMVNLVLQRDWGLVSLYVMPYFRERTFAGADAGVPELLHRRRRVLVGTDPVPAARLPPAEGRAAARRTHPDLVPLRARRTEQLPECLSRAQRFAIGVESGLPLVQQPDLSGGDRPRPPGRHRLHRLDGTAGRHALRRELYQERGAQSLHLRLLDTPERTESLSD